MGWIERVSLCVPLLGMPWISESIAAVSVRPLIAQVVVPAQPVDTPEASTLPSPRPQARRAQLTFPTLNSEQFDRQLQRYLRYVANNGTPDVLVVGSSRALWGVDPVALERSLATRGHADLRIYNFGINGATAQVVDLLLRRLLTPDQLPRLVIWADGSRAFNSGRIDQTFNRIVRSPGYRQLVAGKRPTAPVPDEVEQVCLGIAAPAPLSSSSPTGKWQACTPPVQISMQPERSAKSNQPAALSIEEATGFQPLSTRFDPAIYFQQFPRVSGRFDADYRNFSLGGRQTTAFQNVLNYLRSQRVPVVFVNLPLTQVYLDRSRSFYEQEFRAFMQQFANAGRLTVYDLSRQWLTQHNYFVDPSHLNRYGAAAVAGLLARNLAGNSMLVPYLACAPALDRHTASLPVPERL
jgi:hypothetical protein